ncbi:MAG: DUF2332 family protein [Rhodobacter sp.]|nr:DUF2332 family protein [Rhodobacter sp.]
MELSGQVYGPAGAPVRLTPAWDGPPPPHCPPVVADRAGRRPEPAGPAADRLRILSYIWAGQDDRLPTPAPPPTWPRAFPAW